MLRRLQPASGAATPVQLLMFGRPRALYALRVCLRQGRAVHMDSIPIKSRDKQHQLPDVTVGATDGECAAYLKRVAPMDNGRLDSVRHDYIRASSLFRKIVAARHKLLQHRGRLGESSYMVLFRVCSKLGAHEFVQQLSREMKAAGVSQTPTTIALAMETAVVAKLDPTPYLAELQALNVPPSAGVQKAYLGYLMKRTTEHTAATLAEREAKARAFLKTVPHPSLTARTLIVGCSRDLASAQRHRRSLPEKARDMPEVWGLLLRVCLDTADHEAADKIIATMSQNRTATAAHWNVLLLTYLKAGVTEKVPRGIQRMLSAGFAADTYTYSTYFSVLALEARRCGQPSVAKAEALFSLAMHQDLSFAQKIYGGLLEVYSATGDVAKAAALRKLQRENKVRESARFVELYRICEQTAGLIPSAEAVPLGGARAAKPPAGDSISLSASHMQSTSELDQLQGCLKVVGATGNSSASDSRWYVANT
ncbi:hypothetical protein DIPPA_24358 [Diplonema papillatum]|nr:hypothetical protein DIPPA_24358 [Diplonema papillatum]